MTLHQAPRPTEERVAWYLLGAGTVYLVVSWCAPAAFRHAGIAIVVGAVYTDREITTFALMFILLFTISVTAFVGGLFNSDIRYHLREALTPKPVLPVVVAFLAGIAGSWLLHRTGYWPWIGRHNPYSQVLVGLHSASQSFLLLAMLVCMGMLVPLIEELIFRYAIPRLMSHRPNDHRWLVLLISATLFSLAHFGPHFRASEVFSRAGLLYLGFGLFAGYITERNHGRIACAVGLHSARNLSELIAVIAMAPS